MRSLLSPSQRETGEGAWLEDQGIPMTYRAHHDAIDGRGNQRWAITRYSPCGYAAHLGVVWLSDDATEHEALQAFFGRAPNESEVAQ